MRVCLVCPYSWSVPGGVQSHVAGLAAALRGLGAEVEILAPADGPAEGVLPLGRSLPVPSNGSVQRVALSPATVARTARLVRSRGYDVVHVHEPFLPAACLTAVVAARVPVVATAHMYRRALLWYAVFAPLVRLAVRRVDVLLAVSAAAAEYVRRGTGRTAELVLVGPSGSFGERVRALGRLADADLRRELARADVLVAPSLGGESFGIVLLEAMAAGLPVVASDIPGYRQLVPAEAGRLVPPADPDALAAVLAGLLADAGLRRRLGEAGRRAAAAYAWPRVAQRVLAAYARAGAARGTGAAGCA